MNSVKFRHIRYDRSKRVLTDTPDDYNLCTRGGVTVAYITDPVTLNTYFGMSVCAPSDPYIKALGRQLALNRLFQNLVDGITFNAPAVLTHYYDVGPHTEFARIIGNIITHEFILDIKNG
jgi:hypothetical protein